MTASNLDNTALQQALQSEIELLNAFNNALSQEAELLLGEHDNDALHHVTQQKVQFSEKLAQAHQQRDDALKNLDLPNTSAGLQAAVNKHDTLAPLVDELYRLADQAKTQNESNGMLIDTFLQHNEQALNALSQLLQPAEKVYDARGKATIQRSNSRASIKA